MSYHKAKAQMSSASRRSLSPFRGYVDVSAQYSPPQPLSPPAAQFGVVHVPVHPIPQMPAQVVTMSQMVKKPVTKVVERPVEVEKIVYVDKVVFKEVEVPVEKIVIQDREVPVERIVTKEIPVEVEVPVERIITKEVPVEVEKIAERIITKEVPVEVEKIVVQNKFPEQCTECRSFLVQDRCNVCLLAKRLDLPQAPVIASQAGFHWSAADSEEMMVQVIHSQKDGWQNLCPVILYVTTDGSEPSADNYKHAGESPLRLSIAESCSVKAIAVNNQSQSSIVASEDFKRLESCGIGLLLQTMSDYKGIYVARVIEGGPAWKNAIIQPGDEVKAVDGVNVENYNLSSVTKLVVGAASTEIKLKILREDRDENGRTIDEQGVEFFVTLQRGSIDKNPDPTSRQSVVPIRMLEGYRRVSVEVDTANEARGIWIHRKLQKNKEGLHAASGGMEMSHFKMQRSTATPGGENPNGEMGKEVKTLPLPVQRSAAPPNGNKSSDQFETFATSLQSTPRSTTSKSRVTPSSIDDGLHGRSGRGDSPGQGKGARYDFFGHRIE